jgi:hypothetical protein
MAKRTEADRLIMLARRVIETYRAKPRISPRWVASQVMDQLDPDHGIQLKHHDIWIGAHLMVRQIARSVLAHRYWDGTEPDPDEKPDLFPGLQWRYPRAHSLEDEPEYVLLDLMTEEDVEWNCNRLRAEATAKFDHATALQAWSKARKGSA